LFPKIQRAALGWVVPLTWAMLILLCLRLLPWRKYNKKEVGEGVIQQLGSAGNLHINLRHLPDATDSQPASPSFKFANPDPNPCDPSGYGIHTEFWQLEIFLRE